jgi:hypothetical protein
MSVDEIAQKLIPCTCGGYGENNRRHMSDCPRHAIAWEDIAAALRAERAKFAAENERMRKVLEDMAALSCPDIPSLDVGDMRKGLHCGVEDRNLRDRYDGADYGFEDACERWTEWVTNTVRAALRTDSTKQAAEDAAGGKK